MDLHLFHNIVAMGFDRSLGAAYRGCNLPISPTPNNKRKDLPLTWRQSRKLAPTTAHCRVICYRRFDRFEQFV